MTDIQRHISMCTRHHVRWKRMVGFARTERERERYLERAVFWLEMQTALVSLWAAEQKASGPEMKRRLVEAKSNLLVRIASYGRTIEDEADQPNRLSF